MSADQERADFKSALVEILERYMKPTDLEQPGHCVSCDIPEGTSMDDAARFFFSMLNKFVATHFSEDSSVLYNDASIMIGYDGVYQCLSMGIVIYEG